MIKQSRKRSDKGWDDEAVDTEILPLEPALDELADRVVSIVRTQQRALTGETNPDRWIGACCAVEQWWFGLKQ